MIKVRPAVARDISFIAFAAETFARKSYPIDRPHLGHICDVVETAVGNSDALVAVLDDDGAFAGCFMGTIGQNLLSGSMTCAEVFFWVEPRYRGHGRKLLKYAQNWARSKGCKTFALSAPHSAERANKVFEKWGFEPSEVWYRKAL